jgi:hypothetical protein
MLSRFGFDSLCRAWPTSFCLGARKKNGLATTTTCLHAHAEDPLRHAVASGPSTSLHHANVEMRVSDDAPQAYPKREKHFRATRISDVAEINDVVRLPAEPLAKIFCHFALRRRFVAADKEVVIAGHS